MAFGTCDNTDEYMHIGTSTTSHAILQFYTDVGEIFGDTYLCTLTTLDVARISAINKAHGFQVY